MKNISVNPTVWQPISNSSNEFNNLEDKNTNTSSRLSPYFNTLKGFFSKATVYTNTFYV